MKKKLLLFLLFVFVFTSTQSFGQTVEPFALRYQISAKGSIDFVSNTILQCNGLGGGGSNCADLDTQLPPTVASWSQNNDHVAEYIDIDGDASTFSSSSDSLNLSDCSEIVFAGIYWGGRSDDGDLGYPDRDSILIDANGTGYTSVVADVLIDAGAAEGLGNRVYYCYSDITELVQANPIKSLYTVGNMYSRLQSGVNRWGGWNIVVVYKNDLLPMRSLNVFDGLVNVNNAGTDVEVGISGFLTPPSGAVTFEVGVYGYDGDRGFTGDSLLFDGGSGFVAISDALNPQDDIFNFSQTNRGSVSSSQLPLKHNNISIDADIFEPDNSGFAYIGNSQSSASVKVTTNNETVQVQAITLAIDVYEPDIRAGVRVEDINGATVEPGDTLEYTVVASNIGSDPSIDTYVLDTLASNLTYVPESVEITFGPNAGAKTDATGDDQVDVVLADNAIRVNIGTGADELVGGELLNSPDGIDSTVFIFRAVVIEDCIPLQCNDQVENQAFIFGTGFVSGNDIDNGSNPGVFDIDGCPVIGTTSLTVDLTDCTLPSDTTVASYCEGVVFDAFPYDELGYSYFDPSFASATEATAAGTYYAISAISPECADTIEITITTYFDAVSTSMAGADETACVLPGTETLAGNNPMVGSGTWTVTAGGGTVTTPGAFDSGVTGLTAGVNTFVWTISNGVGCPTSIDEITITVADLPTIAEAGPAQELCFVTTSTLAGNDPLVGTGNWTVIAGGGAVTTPGVFNSDVTGLTLGINTFRWTISNGDCSPSFDEVTIVINADGDVDGTCDADDLDQDNDGIPDADEAPGDMDGDGFDNYLDLDSDNDGIPDLVEAGGVDSDGDGRVDGFTDADGNGLDDDLEITPLPNGDQDEDGVLNVFDLDSDNDGSPDVIEANGTDIDGDGYLDDLTDTDGDGFADLHDTDNNLIVGIGDGGTALSDPNSDADDLHDRLDLDSDNDGLSDVVENGGDDGIGDGLLDDFSDIDNDGFSDAADTDDNTVPGPADGGDALPYPDLDLDGLPNCKDHDSDNDGIVDAIEAGGIDADGDGVLDGFADVDNDGFSDVVDTDNNTIPGVEDGGSALENPNTDGTSGPDYSDIDADGDGIIDNVEGQPTLTYIVPTGMDADGDGIDNAYDPDSGGSPIVPNNYDGDEKPDYQDLDTDADGEIDLLEGHDLDGSGAIDGSESAPVGTDTDGDGLDDEFDVVVLAIGTSGINAGNLSVDPLTDGVLADADSPGLGDLDFRDLDSDEDGVDDSVDLDDDNDGILDVDEGDEDFDGDGFLNRLDLDSDNDGIPDIKEAGGPDVDGGGVVDDFTDLDLDGLDDVIAGDPLFLSDFDFDGLYDFIDLDSDNDGTQDILEVIGGVDSNGDGVADDLTDLDEDGFADIYDTDDNLTPGLGDGGLELLLIDWDEDFTPDIIDLDSDNDGIPDIIENGGTDINGDGVLDGFVDVDGDGFADVVDTDDNTVVGVGDGGTNLPMGDFDFDQIKNYLDTDSDNDGIIDLIEAGGTDVDQDGQIDDFTDVDGDGFADAVDTENDLTPEIGDGGTSFPIPNTDGIGEADYLDIDADDDGIIDNIEAQLSDVYTAPSDSDSDLDGWDDAYDPDDFGTAITPNDHDGDLTPDYRDLNTDNDDEIDAIEGHDLNGNGIIDGAENEALGTDMDGDGLDDGFDSIILSAVTAGTNAGNGTINPMTDGVIADIDSPGAGNLDFREIDNDGDGVDDADDLDDDNDGITDLQEGAEDSDGDGIVDNLDLDSDNDGIADIVEAGGTDIDGDGLIDGFDDGDGDGLHDDIAADPLENPNSDGHGKPDAQDLDSDNDGLQDVIEAGGIDTNGDGVLDDLTDSDEDGFADLHDTDDGGTTLPNLDSDLDAVVNRVDRDSDNDGIADLIENDGIDSDGNGILDDLTDTDNDGFANSVDTDDGGTNLPTENMDLDLVPNYLDLDSDNDGIVDAIEAGGIDADGNGKHDDFADPDGDGFSNVMDADEGGTPLTLPMTDAMGHDYLDIDSDNDGIVDNVEAQSSAIFVAALESDTDGDGLDDAYDSDDGGTPIVLTDSDGDGTQDRLDLDSDNDGEDDLLEGHDLNGNGVIDGAEKEITGIDTDNDGLDDGFDTIVLSDVTSGVNAGNGAVDPLTDDIYADADSPGTGDLDFRETDYDGDGIPNQLDEDDDNDGITDLAEDLNEDGDNNPMTNPTDTDQDGVIDIFDLDSDNDGISDIAEAGGEDADLNGITDNIEIDGTLQNDTDNNGLDDFYSTAVGGTDILNADSDSDGYNNTQDLDSDNDGVYDLVEDGGIDADNNGIVDDWIDTDVDGIPDYADVDETGGADVDVDGIDDEFQVGDDDDLDGIANDFDHDQDNDGRDDDNFTDGSDDIDSDGVADRIDLDSDNDGTPDILEIGELDSDGNGQIDAFEDLNGDGANDDLYLEILNDTDEDGVPNHEDLDSDNDGIADAEENGRTDANNDGYVDGFVDANGDGWHDVEQTTLQTDTDADGITDDAELDSDDDGIDDIIEGGGIDANDDGLVDDFVDANTDGLDDGGALSPPDSDSDGMDDYQDVDSDNDTVLDSEEYDPNGDGDGPDDSDGDGLNDYVDADDDNDGYPTTEEAIKDAGGNYADCDGDGRPDYLDSDICELVIPDGFSPDGDGINDLFVILGIQGYPNSAITIFNRWGNKVYEANGGYPNDWDGSNQFGVSTGSRELPVGTYFYVLDLGDGSEVIKGFVFINK